MSRVIATRAMDEPSTTTGVSAEPDNVDRTQVSSAGLRAHCRRSDRALIVEFDHARLDAFIAPMLVDFLSQLDLFGVSQVVFDLGGVDVLDSSALAAMMRACRHMPARVAVGLAAPSAQVLELLHLTEVDRLLEVFPSVGSALTDGAAAPNSEAREGPSDAGAWRPANAEPRRP